MSDPRLVKRFKQVSREDILIADALARIVGRRPRRSLLEIGAGPGAIARRLSARGRADCAVTVVEPCVAYHGLYPSGTRVVAQPWEQCDLREHFDLVIMSHVIGHFAIAERERLVTRAVECLAPAGTMLIVTNGPCGPFWPLNLAMARTQGWQYVIDFCRLETHLSEIGVRWRYQDVTTPLFLGRDMDACLDLMNALFPARFSPAERRMVMNVMRWLWRPEGFVLDLVQRIYHIEGCTSVDGTELSCSTYDPVHQVRKTA